MVRSEHEYKDGSRSLAYDNYAENAKQTRMAQANTAMQALQTGLMAQMSSSLGNIANTMDSVRQQTADTLAIQRELLERDNLQRQLEEFIFQGEKLVDQCRGDQLPVSSRYFLLKGVSETIKRQGIGTAIVRGRENKAAFERVASDVDRLVDQLKNDKQVIEAIAWARKEQERKDQERRERNNVRDAKLQEKRREIARLQHQRRELADQRVTLEFLPWFKEKAGGYFTSTDSGLMKGVKWTFALWIVGFPAVLWFLAVKSSTEAALNEGLNKQIERLDKQIDRLT